MLVTIIIPVYNAEEYLKECLKSVLCQTYVETEIILVNDGSTDASVEICDQYAEKYENVISLHQENGGVSKARNHGLSYAKGEYVYFCDSDDILHCDILSELVHNIEVSKADISCCKYQSFSEKLYWQDSSIEERNEILTGMDMFYSIFKNSYNSGYLWNKLFKRSIIEQKPTLRFMETLSIVEDQKFVLEYLCRCESMSLSPRTLYGYRWNENSATQNKFSERKLTSILGREEIWKICEKRQCNEEILSIAWNMMMKFYVYGYKNLLFNEIPNKRYWKKFIKEKFLEYSSLPYKKDDAWSWKQKGIYYYMKFLFGSKK